MSDNQPVWINDHYYVIKPGQFGYGYDIYRKGGKLVEMSAALFRSREAVLDAVEKAIIELEATPPAEAAP